MTKKCKFKILIYISIIAVFSALLVVYKPSNLFIETLLKL